MLTKDHLKHLAQARLKDSVLLLEAGQASSAYYLAGYVVELALKACIATLFQQDVIPDKNFVNAVYTHSLEHLLKASGLLPQFKEDVHADVQLAANWGIVAQWSESSRYQTWDIISATASIEAIRDPDHGVFQWVTKHW